MDRARAEAVTASFTKQLATIARELGDNVTPSVVAESGNVAEGETGYVFSVRFGGHTFHVEVYGPTYDQN